jgi:transposase InsO family protein
MHAPRRAKANIQGHLQATAAGQVWVMDVLRLERTDSGDHFLLCAVDVFSRYAVVEKMSAATSELTLRAFSDRILTICKPELIITDGGSEFKALFKTALDQLQIGRHTSTAHHSESHGLVERFNRTFTRTLSHMLRDEPKSSWPDFLGAALIAYNCTPHTSHQLPPMQVFFDTVDKSLLTTGDFHPQLQGQGSALEVVKARQAMKKLVHERLAKYQGKMRTSSQELRRTTRTLKVGEVVLVFRETGSRLKDKWNDRFDGPFVVTEICGPTVYMVQRLGSDDAPQQEHVDNLIAAPVLPDSVPVKLNDTDLKTSTKTKFQVEKIVGQEADKFLIKWVGYDVATWEPLQNLDCSLLIKKWQQLGKSEQREIQLQHTKLASSVVSAISLCPLTDLFSDRSDTYLIRDVADFEYGKIITGICASQGIRPDQLVLVWSSPMCRTYARANLANAWNNNHFRDTKDSAHPPKDCVDAKREMDVQHDAIIHSLLASFERLHSFDPHCCVAMENPAASLRMRPFVRMFELVLSLTRHTVNYCAYLVKVFKPTDVWVNFPWTPQGTTGDGLCHRACFHGQHVMSASGRKSFRHPEHLAGKAAALPKGFMATSRVPTLLHQELLSAARLHHVVRGSNGPERKYVLELFAGTGSLRDVAAASDLLYIGVDISKRAHNIFMQRLHTQRP